MTGFRALNMKALIIFGSKFVASCLTSWFVSLCLTPTIDGNGSFCEAALKANNKRLRWKPHKEICLLSTFKGDSLAYISSATFPLTIINSARPRHSCAARSNEILSETRNKQVGTLIFNKQQQQHQHHPHQQHKQRGGRQQQQQLFKKISPYSSEDDAKLAHQLQISGQINQSQSEQHDQISHVVGDQLGLAQPSKKKILQ